MKVLLMIAAASAALVLPTHSMDEDEVLIVHAHAIALGAFTGCTKCTTSQDQSPNTDLTIDCSCGSSGTAGAVVPSGYDPTHGTCDANNNCTPLTNCSAEIDVTVQIDDSCHDEIWVDAPNDGEEDRVRIINDKKYGLDDEAACVKTDGPTCLATIGGGQTISVFCAETGGSLLASYTLRIECACCDPIE